MFYLKLQEFSKSINRKLINNLTLSFSLKYKAWHSGTVFPDARAKAKIAPVEVPLIQSKQWTTGASQMFSIERSIRVKTYF
jgi:hypothetical protein